MYIYNNKRWEWIRFLYGKFWKQLLQTQITQIRLKQASLMLLIQCIRLCIL